MAAPTYIIGHKNPDADAICSAIGYAAFKQAIGEEGYIAARCGNSNARIDAILHRFNTPLPVFVNDFTPRVRDVMNRNVIKVNQHATCAEALELIDHYDVRAVPVMQEDASTVLGFVSIFSLGEFFIPKPREPRAIRHVRTSIHHIVKALNAEVLHARESEKFEDLYVRIGAMDIRSFGKFTTYEHTAPKESIIVVGDRWDIQQKSIQIGVRLLVITGSLEVEEEIVEQARERGVSLIISPFDSATTSWIIRTATKLEDMVDTDFMQFSPDEKLSTVKRKVANSSAPIFIVMDEGQLVGIFTKTDLLKPIETQVVMVDHNEIGQAANGIEEVNIVEIIDHHRLGNPPTHQPIHFRNEIIGSTSSIIAEMFRARGIQPSPEVAGVLMGGLISDTLNLQSPTSTPRDEAILPWLAEIAGVTPDAIADLVFKSGSVVLSYTADEIITADCKPYEDEGIKFSVSQVEELGFNNFHSKSNEILEALERYRNDNNLCFSVLLVTDINTQNSILLVHGPSELLDSISFAQLSHHTFELPGIVSRKKQLIPYISSLLDSVELTHEV